MNVRFVTRQVHAFLDYPVAISLMAYNQWKSSKKA